MKSNQKIYSIFFSLVGNILFVEDKALNKILINKKIV